MATPQYKKEAFKSLRETLKPVLDRFVKEGYFLYPERLDSTYMIGYDEEDSRFSVIYQEPSSVRLEFHVYPDQVVLLARSINMNREQVISYSKSSYLFASKTLNKAPKTLYKACKSLFYEYPGSKTLYPYHDTGYSIVIKEGYVLGRSDYLTPLKQRYMKLF